EAVGAPPHGGISERRVPRRTLRGLDRARRAPGSRARANPKGTSAESRLDLQGDPVGGEVLRRGRREARLFRLARGRDRRGGPRDDRDPGRDSRGSRSRHSFPGEERVTEKLAERGAVVTGGGRGIGAAVARALAVAGAKVVVAARTSREIDKVATELTERGAVA